MTRLEQIINDAKNKGYAIKTAPYALNIIGVRNSKASSQKKFDDELAYFYYDQSGKLIGNVAEATTDPSDYYLQSPLADASKLGGTSILKSGEYKDAYSIGLHRGKYNALVQVKPVTVIRDNDRNAYINYFAPTQTGLFGINIHHAAGTSNAPLVDKYSAGCQVFRNVSDFNQMMQWAETSKARHGNKFTYILLDSRDELKKNNTLFLGIGLILIAGFIYLKTKK